MSEKLINTILSSTNTTISNLITINENNAQTDNIKIGIDNDTLDQNEANNVEDQKDHADGGLDLQDQENKYQVHTGADDPLDYDFDQDHNSKGHWSAWSSYWLDQQRHVLGGANWDEDDWGDSWWGKTQIPKGRMTPNTTTWTPQTTPWIVLRRMLGRTLLLILLMKKTTSCATDRTSISGPLIVFMLIVKLIVWRMDTTMKPWKNQPDHFDTYHATAPPELGGSISSNYKYMDNVQINDMINDINNEPENKKSHYTNYIETILAYPNFQAPDIWIKENETKEERKVNKDINFEVKINDIINSDVEEKN